MDDYHIEALPKTDRGLPFAKGAYRSLDSILLHNKAEVLEGVIADTAEPGIGFRNHTVPLDLALGGQWTEDVSWVEPQTVCVDTGLSFEISTAESKMNISQVDLIDQGGFTNLPRRMTPILVERPQEPNLTFRAQQAVEISNAFLMFYFNVSHPNNTGPRNTSLGRRFPLKSNYKPDLNAIALTKLRPTFLDFASQPHSNLSSGLSTSAQAQLGVTSQDWSRVQETCETPSVRMPNISNLQISCGYLLGAPRSIGKGPALVYEPKSKFNQSLYVCASSIRASIKRVTFSMNDSVSLDNLRVVNTADKPYKDDASKPLWAIERTYRPSFDAAPLWGMIEDRFENAQDLSTYRGDKFWLPMNGQLYSTMSIASDSLAATDAFGNALGSAYDQQPLSLGDSMINYSGVNNVALNRLWQQLSQSPTTASRIIDLIFTEILATALVGTKSVMSQSSNSKPDPPITVRPFRRQIQYNLIYAIPAFVVMAIALVVSVALLFCLAFQCSLQRMSQILNQTSAGRIVTNMAYPGLCEADASTKQWLDAAGHVKLAFPFIKPQTGEEQSMIQQVGSGSGDGSVQYEHHKPSKDIKSEWAGRSSNMD